ncbi:MAG TPA: hypothetical protein VGP47_09460, partial [Parachlamydiaceae bacterium]|nr:hypothetical protein [Parachlamydiaceae bacterium]
MYNNNSALTPYNHPERNQEYLNDHIGPECETIKSKACGAGTVKLVKTNEFYGILISGGQIDEQRLRTITEKWKMRFGDSIQAYDGPDQYKFILQRYFSNIFESNESQEAIGYNKLGPANTSREATMTASMQPLSGTTLDSQTSQDNVRKRKVSESTKLAEQANQTYHSETSDINADAEAKKNEFKNLGVEATNDNNAKIHELHSQIGCTEINNHFEMKIRERLKSLGIDYQGQFTPFGSLKITSLEEFDKWFPGHRRTEFAGTYLSNIKSELVHLEDKGFFIVHVETGVVLEGMWGCKDSKILSQLEIQLVYDVSCTSNVETSIKFIQEDSERKSKAAEEKRITAEEQLK